MLPLQFDDKRAALIGAFLNRLSIGIVLGMSLGSPQLIQVALPTWLVGILVGLLLSAADAVITKAYVPILVIGAIGGGVIASIIGMFGSRA
jgi:hypothetical protein